MSEEPRNTTVRTVVMAKEVTRKWVEKHASVEYRFQAFVSPKYFGSLLRAFRDGRVKLSSVEPIPDLGVEEMSQGVQVWSSHVEPLRTLERYFSRMNVETSWIW